MHCDPGALALNSVFAEKLNGLLYQAHIDRCIVTGAIGAVVDNPVDRRRIDILYSQRQIAFACDRNNAVGPKRGDSFSRKRSAIYNLYIQSVFGAQFQQLANGAAAALHAVIDVIGYFAVTDIDLEAMRQENKYAIAFYPFALRLCERVIDFDKRGAKAIAAYADQSAERNSYGEQNAYRNRSLFMRIEQIDAGKRGRGNQEKAPSNNGVRGENAHKHAARKKGMQFR